LQNTFAAIEEGYG